MVQSPRWLIPWIPKYCPALGPSRRNGYRFGYFRSTVRSNRYPVRGEKSLFSWEILEMLRNCCAKGANSARNKSPVFAGRNADFAGYSDGVDTWMDTGGVRAGRRAKDCSVLKGQGASQTLTSPPSAIIPPAIRGCRQPPDIVPTPQKSAPQPARSSRSPARRPAGPCRWGCCRR
jgi:hypothetical protein